MGKIKDNWLPVLAVSLVAVAVAFGLTMSFLPHCSTYDYGAEGTQKYCSQTEWGGTRHWRE